MQVLSRRTKNNPVLIGEPGRRQDRGRRGARPADRRRRRPRLAQGPPAAQPRPGRDGRRREVPRRVRGAAQGRPQRDQGVRGPGHHLHRRAAHGRRRGRRRRLRDGRRQHAQADAGARRAADDRRDHARRVPRADREGPRARAPLPAGLRRRAVRRGHHRDPARAAGEVRGPPRREDHRRRAGRRRDALRPLHHRPQAARQGDRPRRRGRLPAAHGDRVLAGRDRPAPPLRRPDEDGGARARAGDRRGVQGPARAAPRRPRRPARRSSGSSRRAGSARRPGSRAPASCASRSTQLRVEADRLQREGDLAKASEILYGRIPALEKQIEAAEAAERTSRTRSRWSSEEVGPEEIAEVVEAWTGIPTGRLLEGETAQAAAHGGGHRRAADRPAGRGRRGLRRRTPLAGRDLRPGPAHRARSSSSARPASARPSWPSRWRTSSSTTSGRSCAST